MNAQAYRQYVAKDGSFTIDGLQLLNAQESRITALEAKLALIAAITPPTGGATIDAQARTAIGAILTAAT